MTHKGTACARERRVPAPPTTLRMSLERAVSDGRALLESDAPVAWHAGAAHNRETRLGPPTLGAAGAVMAMTLGVRAGEDAAPDGFAARWGASLNAIDRMRWGDWEGAWKLFHGVAENTAVRTPHKAFAKAIEAQIDRPANEVVHFRTPETYRAWLDHCEGELLGVIEGVEDTLTARLAPVRPPPAPQTLAAALRVALSDGWALASNVRGGNARYHFNSGFWHNAEGEPCVVCAAGSVMAGTLGAHAWATVYPDSFAYPWMCALKAIDALRARYWRSAFSTMYGMRHAGAEPFANAMRTHPRLEAEALSDFANLEEYEDWLGHVETTLLPAVAANEAQMLEIH